MSEKRIIIVSDLHHRISGVSASIRALIPHMVERYDVFFIAHQSQGAVPARSLWDLFRLLRQWNHHYAPIWHVRRNNEMLWGILFRLFINRRLKLVFTSAAIRKHSKWPRWLISKMDSIISVSQKAAQFMPMNSPIVPHGVDLARFAISGRHEFDWSKYANKIGIVGRVRPEKGTDIFIKSICETLPLVPEACAVVVGKTTSKYLRFKAQLVEQVEKAGLGERVFFTDEVPLSEMPYVYGSLDIICAPSRYEGFGLVPIEAMVSGTAVIAARTGAYEDMVKPNVNGELIEIGDQAQLSKYLSNLLANEVELGRYKESGKLTARTFSLEREMEGISKTYQVIWESQ